MLRENGELRELALDDTPPPPQANKPARARRGRAASRAAAQATRRAAKARPPAPPVAPEGNRLATAAQLFSQANLVPKFENGEMVGVQVDAIQAGSAFEAAGIQSGEVITELNGIAINSQEQSQRALAEFADSDILNVKVRGADQNEREVEVLLNPTD